MYRIRVKGVEIACETPQEVAELIKQLGKEGIGELPPLTPSYEKMPPRERYRKILEAVLEAGERGISSEDFVHIARLKGTNGIGAFIKNFGDALAKHELLTREVLSKEWVGDNKRWVANHRAREALERLR